MNVIDILASPWAIVPDRLDELTRIYATKLAGEKIDGAAIEAKIGKALQRKSQGYKVRNGVAIIPIDGVIAKRMNLFTQVSGGASTQLIERDFRAALEASDVRAIILHADTPGGTVDGTAELAETIYNARGRKPVYALADGLMASAGVWIGTAADRVYVTGGTTAIGSIGVVTQHIDRSARDAQVGIKVSEVYAGKYKRIASEHAPLTDEGREHLQGQVDYLYSIFVDAVARHRGTSTATVLERMADGRLFVGQQAIDAGLADGMATLDELVNTLAGRSPTTDRSVSGKTPDASGAAAEIERIKSIQAIALPGHDELIDSLILDGKTTGLEAARLVLAAEKARVKTTATRRQAEKPERTPTVDTLKARWESNASLRAEFGTFARFEHYSRNKDRLRIL